MRPPQAGTREAAEYGTSFNKESLGNLKAMFEQKQKSSGKNYDPPKKFGKYNMKISQGVPCLHACFCLMIHPVHVHHNQCQCQKCLAHLQHTCCLVLCHMKSNTRMPKKHGHALSFVFGCIQLI